MVGDGLGEVNAGVIEIEVADGSRDSILCGISL